MIVEEIEFLKKLMSRASGLYVTMIRIVESNLLLHEGVLKSDSYRLRHDRLGHPGRDMMIRILQFSHGHPFH